MREGRKINCIKPVYYWWAPSHLADKTWLFLSLHCIFATGLLGAAGPTEGCPHTHPTWGSASKIPQASPVSLSAATQLICASNTASAHTHLTNKGGQHLAAVNRSRSRGIKKPKLIMTPEVLVLNPTWKTPERPLIMKWIKQFKNINIH